MAISSRRNAVSMSVKPNEVFFEVLAMPSRSREGWWLRFSGGLVKLKTSLHAYFGVGGEMLDEDD